MTMKINEENGTIDFTGEIQWATVPPNQARGKAAEYKTDANKDDTDYSISVECSRDEFAQLKKYKLPKLVQLNEDEETGKTYLKIKTSKTKTNLDPNKNHGQPYIFKDIPVLVRDESGTAVPVTVPLANGSTALVRAKLIETKTGHTLRLTGVLVEKLIEYKRSSSSNPFSDLGVEVADGNPHEGQEAHSQDLSSSDDGFDF